MDIMLLAFILLTAFRGAIAQVQLEPIDVAVLRGSEARFNCSLSRPDWVVMSWLLNDSIVLTITKTTGVIGNSDRYTALNYTTDQSYKWEFVLWNAQLNESREVSCDVQNIERKTATLSVQESGTVAITSGNVTAIQNQLAIIHCLALSWSPAPHLTWKLDGTPANRDNYTVNTEALGGLFNSNSTLVLRANRSTPVECLASVPAMTVPERSTVFLTVVPESPGTDKTVVIAVTVTVLAVALLVLLIVGIIFFCRRKRAAKSSYEDEVRKTRSLSERNTSEAAQGKENIAYSPDDSTLGVVPSVSNNGDFGRTNSFHTTKMPDVLYNSNHTANGHDPSPVQGTLGSKKHRHATIV